MLFYNSLLHFTQLLHFLPLETPVELKIVFLDDHAVVSVMYGDEPVRTVDIEVDKLVISDGSFDNVYR